MVDVYWVGVSVIANDCVDDWVDVEGLGSLLRGGLLDKGRFKHLELLDLMYTE